MKGESTYHILFGCSDVKDLSGLRFGVENFF